MRVDAHSLCNLIVKMIIDLMLLPSPAWDSTHGFTDRNSFLSGFTMQLSDVLSQLHCEIPLHYSTVIIEVEHYLKCIRRQLYVVEEVL